MGEYTASLFKVVSLTLLCSWLLAITMTSMLCYMFIKVKTAKKKEGEAYSSPAYRKYRSILSTVLRHPGKHF